MSAACLVPQLLGRGYKVTVYDMLLFRRDCLLPNNPNLTRDRRATSATPRSSREALRGQSTPCASRLHLQRRELRARREPVEDDQLRLLRADGARGQEGRREALRLLLVELGLRRVSDSPDVTEEHPLVPLTLYNKYKGMCEPLLLEAQGRRLHLRHDPAGDGLRLQPAHAARSVGQHPHQPCGQQGQDHRVRRRRRCGRTCTSRTWSTPTS